MKVNLLPREIQFKKRRWFRGFLVFVMVSLGVALGVYYIFHWQNEISVLEDRLMMVEEEYSLAWAELSGYKDIKGLAEDVKDRERILVGLEEKHYSGLVLAELSAVSARDVQVREFSINGRVFSLRGEAISLTAVARISEELRALGVYEDLQLSIDRVNSEGSYPVSFSLSGQRKGVD